jgi:tetratricopeptide (TPR) repeat protein
MKDLVEVFDMANLLAVVGQNEEAYQYYRFLLTEYQSREVYNNVGATAMLQALKLFTDNELLFRYPIQLDLQMANHRGDAEMEKRNKLLWQAVLHFDAAISLDPQYAPAYLNKACALALLGETTRAYFYADVETRATAKGKYAGLQQDLEVLLGILDAQPNTEEAKAKAKKRFEAVLAQKAGGVAAYNLAKLSGETITTQEKSFTDEEIDGESVFLMEPDIDLEKPKLEMGEGLAFVRNPKKTAHGQLYSSISAANGFTMFLLTNTDYKGETAEGIKIGATRQEIEAKYGLAPKVIQTIVGEILAYKGLLFMLKADKLERWVTYKLPG